MKSLAALVVAMAGLVPAFAAWETITQSEDGKVFKIEPSSVSVFDSGQVYGEMITARILIVLPNGKEDHQRVLTNYFSCPAGGGMVVFMSLDRKPITSLMYQNDDGTIVAEIGSEMCVQYRLVKQRRIDSTASNANAGTVSPPQTSNDSTR